MLGATEMYASTAGVCTGESNEHVSY